jgi:hypothetical protein
MTKPEGKKLHEKAFQTFDRILKLYILAAFSTLPIFGPLPIIRKNLNLPNR